MELTLELYRMKGKVQDVHAQPRATKDLDIVIRADPENGRAVYAALAKFGAPVAGLKAEDLTEPGNFFRMGTLPVRLWTMIWSLSAGDVSRARTRRAL